MARVGVAWVALQMSDVSEDATQHVTVLRLAISTLSMVLVKKSGERKNSLLYVTDNCRRT